ncbi:MAG: hypothetical protein ACKO4K_07525 [Flavobacteriales bacterium]
MRFLYCLLILFPLTLLSQALPGDVDSLKSTLATLRAAKTDRSMNALNQQFKQQMEAFLIKEGAFDMSLSPLTTVVDLRSSDNRVRIIHWNLEYTDFTYSYSGFILHKDEDEQIRLIALTDATDPYTPIPENVVDAKSWYGALYYTIINTEYQNEVKYVLLGWDGASSSNNYKVIDVLSLSGGTAKFGCPLFLNKKKMMKRVVFEYADKSPMSLKMDYKRKRIVFDHLSPESAGLEGMNSYYVPDFSYDAYVWDDDKFVLHEDVIAVSDKASVSQSTIYTLDPKTGKARKKTYKIKWINPSDGNEQDGFAHVARTPETVTQNNPIQEELPPEPKKKWWDRRDPNNLSVTTGKYYGKNRRKPPVP